MKTKIISLAMLLLIFTVAITGCSKDDLDPIIDVVDDPDPTDDPNVDPDPTDDPDEDPDPINSPWLNPNLSYGTLVDQEGNTYATIVIGNQEWMAENLRTIIYANGDTILNEQLDINWNTVASGAWVHYENDSTYDIPFGKLYNWYAVNDNRNLCPPGWHVPSAEEWGILINFLDPNANGGNTVPNTAGGKMKTTGTQFWLEPNGGATNESGFSALPGGGRALFGFFAGSGSDGQWWSSSLGELAGDAQYTSVGSFEGSIGIASILHGTGLCVRCLKD